MSTIFTKKQLCLFSVGVGAGSLLAWVLIGRDASRGSNILARSLFTMDRVSSWSNSISVDALTSSVTSANRTSLTQIVNTGHSACEVPAEVTPELESVCVASATTDIGPARAGEPMVSGSGIGLVDVGVMTPPVIKQATIVACPTKDDVLVGSPGGEMISSAPAGVFINQRAYTVKLITDEGERVNTPIILAWELSRRVRARVGILGVCKDLSADKATHGSILQICNATLPKFLEEVGASQLSWTEKNELLVAAVVYSYYPSQLELLADDLTRSSWMGESHLASVYRVHEHGNWWSVRHFCRWLGSLCQRLPGRFTSWPAPMNTRRILRISLISGVLGFGLFLAVRSQTGNPVARVCEVRPVCAASQEVAGMKWINPTLRRYVEQLLHGCYFIRNWWGDKQCGLRYLIGMQHLVKSAHLKINSFINLFEFGVIKSFVNPLWESLGNVMNVLMLNYPCLVSSRLKIVGSLVLSSLKNALLKMGVIHDSSHHAVLNSILL
nr:hypothetical protein [Tolivirales sp.]